MNKTQPIEGSVDPKEIEDCWEEVFKTIEAMSLILANAQIIRMDKENTSYFNPYEIG